MNEPLCKMPWMALALTGGGDIKPCCQLKGGWGNVHNGDGVMSTLTGDEARGLRRALLKGEKPERCSSCWTREGHIGQSRRKWFETRFAQHIPAGYVYSEDAEPVLVQADLNFSNFCNLKCRMCGSWASHQWFEEDRILSSDRSLHRENRPEKQRLLETDLATMKELIPRLKHARRIDFKGGEPMLARHHAEFLQALIEQGCHTNLHLQYTTNGTTLNPRIVQHLSRFRRVSIVVSLEATGRLYQYIRGGKHDLGQVEANIRAYSELANVTLSFNVATQLYNVLHLRELWRYLSRLAEHPRISLETAFAYTMVNDPPYLNAFILPDSLRAEARARIAGIKDLAPLDAGLANSQFDAELWRTFCRFTDRLDQLRNESVFDAVPEFKSSWDSSANS